jgi:hypothetical protein
LTRKILLISVIAVMLLSVYDVSAESGSGVLYVYEDSNYSILVGTDVNGKYEVTPGQTVYIKIVGIESEFTSVKVRVSYQEIPGQATDLGTFTVLDPTGTRYVGDPSNPIVWTVPSDAIICFTYVVQYRNALVQSSVHVACQPGIIRPGHLHVVPEYPLGTITGIAMCFAAYAALKFKHIRIKLFKDKI